MMEVEFAATTAEGVLIGRPIHTTVLVDSGARTTLLDGGFARTLGLDLSQPWYPKSTIGGIVPGVGGLPVARATLKASLCGRWFDIPVNFNIGPLETQNLLGREGPFERLVVAFWHAGGVILAATA